MGQPAVPRQPEPRRHHYVPRCWLAGFTEHAERDGRLWVTDFSLQRQWASTPGNAGHQHDFYRLPDDPSLDPVLVEQFFSTIEDQAAPVFRTLDRERRPPTNDELDVLLMFMAFQYVRVPAFRPLVLQLHERLLRDQLAPVLRNRETWNAALREMGMDPDAPGPGYEEMQRYVESGEWNLTAETQWYLAQAFNGVEVILASLHERYWGTTVTHYGRLIASDNPVMLDGPQGERVGFQNAVVVSYPVSRHVFVTGTRQRLRPPVENFRYFASLNTSTLLWAHAQVYAHIQNFVWLDENRNDQTDWRLFSKDRFLPR